MAFQYCATPQLKLNAIYQLLYITTTRLPDAIKCFEQLTSNLQLKKFYIRLFLVTVHNNMLLRHIVCNQ